MKLTQHVAERVARRMRMDGFDRCTAQDVWDAYRSSIEAGIVGEEHDAALESRILQELDDFTEEEA